MNFDTFLDKHWDEFVPHICQFHPLEESFILLYKDDLDLYFIENYSTIHGSYDKSTFVECLVLEDLNDITSWLYKGTMGKLKNNSHLLYKHYILPEIEKRGLENIFKAKLDYSQRYYFMEAITYDQYGSTPQYGTEGEDPFELYNPGRNITTIKSGITLKNTGYKDGKSRLLEIIPQRLSGLNPSLVVSENVKTILEAFNLPEHSFTKINLKPDKISTKTAFYYFQLNFNTLTKDVDFDNVLFESTIEYSSNPWVRVESPVTSFEDFEKIIENKQKFGFRATEYLLTTNYDIYTYSVYNKWVVTNRLKKTLEQVLLNQIEFSSAQLLNIRMNQGIYDSMAEAQFDFSKIQPLEYVNKSDELYYYNKMERLQNKEVKISENQVKDDEFKEIQLKLNVIIPEKFKKTYRKGHLVEGYKLLEISSFYKENEYTSGHPESFGAIIFAENGIGDALGLILTKASDFKLRPDIYEFLHEIARIIKY